jgi:hypothetical protein
MVAAGELVQLTEVALCLGGRLIAAALRDRHPIIGVPVDEERRSAQREPLDRACLPVLRGAWLGLPEELEHRPLAQPLRGGRSQIADSGQ